MALDSSDDALGKAVPAGIAFPYRVNQSFVLQERFVVGALPRAKACRSGPFAILRNMGREILFGNPRAQKMSNFYRFQPQTGLFRQKSVDFRVVAAFLGIGNERLETARALASLALDERLELDPNRFIGDLGHR